MKFRLQYSFRLTILLFTVVFIASGNQLKETRLVVVVRRLLIGHIFYKSRGMRSIIESGLSFVLRLIIHARHI